MRLVLTLEGPAQAPAELEGRWRLAPAGWGAPFMQEQLGSPRAPSWCLSLGCPRHTLTGLEAATVIGQDLSLVQPPSLLSLSGARSCGYFLGGLRPPSSMTHGLLPTSRTATHLSVFLKWKEISPRAARRIDPACLGKCEFLIHDESFVSCSIWDMRAKIFVFI